MSIKDHPDQEAFLSRARRKAPAGAATPPLRILLCLGSCRDEFYLPLGIDDAMVCPVDRTHPVAVYTGPTIHLGQTT